MLTKILAILLSLAISVAGYFGYMYKQEQGRYTTLQTAYQVVESDKQECTTILRDAEDHVLKLKHDLAVKPSVVVKYVNKLKLIEKELTQNEKNILDAELPDPVISLLESSSKDAIR